MSNSITMIKRWAEKAKMRAKNNNFVVRQREAISGKSNKDVRKKGENIADLVYFPNDSE